MISVKNLCKMYPGFQVKNVSFDLAPGYIMGFIGKNGAGKTTVLKSVLNLAVPDSGEVKIFGKDVRTDEIEIKKEIGFSFGEIDYYPSTKVKKLAYVFKRFFSNWDERAYQSYLAKFSINENKRLSELSTGMRVKLSVAFALSHDAKLLIFDEPTSGLDPIAREELLSIFKDIVSNGDKSIIFSTHITSDLDKCADYILFIKNGEIVCNNAKDEMIDAHALVAGKTSALTAELKSKLIGYKETAFGFHGLMKKCDYQLSMNLEIAKPNLEDIMIYYSESEKSD